MQKFFLQQADNGVWFGMFPHLLRKGIVHGISTRLGGTSLPPYATLNLGLHVGDDAERVRENRQRFCQALEIEAERVVNAEQVHGDKVFLVTDRETGRGARDYAGAIKGADALITNSPNVPLMLFFADCVPVLIVDPIHRAVGISHAGWKGTVAKIAQKTVLAMQRHFATTAADCLVGIGPSIGPCCYEVDEVVLSKLKENFIAWRDLVEPSGERWRLDLWQANRLQLEEIGVPSGQIVISEVCTNCNTELFFSHRGEKGCTGRIGAVVMLQME
ncbi:multi-copper polyphenol oxidoreductase laccase [Lucifera butyrica]|uniref:Purine nucleoside phosphorylase n=1 Tax=Lucifera butyrica TaxID=1351585 RepID=A0A498R4Y0_9FIRM|nr:peptidoglycan editing factor PgeF [Lucifera butyrica]VBB06199.1 multi-copper polyphenol oxidoreductase laccase [Lucifera butyrica]